MELCPRIKAIYPDLEDFYFWSKIRLQNNRDGTPTFIAKWEHPVYSRPTQEQLDAVGSCWHL
jgi:hypothetical protein